MSFHHLERRPEGYLSFMDPETRLTVHRCIKTACPWVQKNGTGNNLKKGGFLLSLLCDFYQNTEIQHTHKPAQKRSSLFTAIAGTCPPGQPPAGKVGEDSYINREKRIGEPGGSRKNMRRKVKLEH